MGHFCKRLLHKHETLPFTHVNVEALVLTNKRNYIERNFYSVAGVMPQGWDLGVLGESKTLAWGFAMATCQLRILVLSGVGKLCTETNPHIWPHAESGCAHSNQKIVTE